MLIIWKGIANRKSKVKINILIKSTFIIKITLGLRLGMQLSMTNFSEAPALN